MVPSFLDRFEYRNLEKVLQEYIVHEPPRNLKAYFNKPQAVFHREGTRLTTADSIARYLNYHKLVELREGHQLTKTHIYSVFKTNEWFHRLQRRPRPLTDVELAAELAEADKPADEATEVSSDPIIPATPAPEVAQILGFLASFDLSMKSIADSLQLIASRGRFGNMGRSVKPRATEAPTVKTGEATKLASEILAGFRRSSIRNLMNETLMETVANDAAERYLAGKSQSLMHLDLDSSVLRSVNGYLSNFFRADKRNIMRVPVKKTPAPTVPANIDTEALYVRVEDRLLEMQKTGYFKALVDVDRRTLGNVAETLARKLAAGEPLRHKDIPLSSTTGKLQMVLCVIAKWFKNIDYTELAAAKMAAVS